MKNIFYCFLFLCLAYGTPLAAQQAGLMLPIGHSRSVDEVQISADNKYAITQNSSETKLWEINGARLILNYDDRKCFSHDGRKVLIDTKNHIEVMDIYQNKIIASFNCSISLYHLNFSIDDKNIIGENNDTIYIINALDGSMVRKFGSGNSYIQSHTGKYILTYTDHFPCAPKVWNIETGALVSSLPEIQLLKKGFLPLIYEAQFSKNDDSLLLNIKATRGEVTKNGYSMNSEGQYGELSLWNLNSGNFIYKVKNTVGYIHDIKYDSDGNQFAYSNEQGEINIIESNTGKLLRKIKNNRTVSSLLINHAEHVLIAGSEDGLISWYDLADGKLIRRISAHQNTINTLQYSIDGSLLISGAMDHTAKVWDAKSGVLKSNLKGHCVPINYIFLSPDGSIIGTIDSINNLDQTYQVKLWNKYSGSFQFSNKSKFNTDIMFDPSMKYRGMFSSPYQFKGMYKGSPFYWQGNIGVFVNDIALSNNSYAVNVANKYSLFIIDSNDFLIVDKLGHYDGSEGARKLLYFTCGTEVVALEQFKDLCWEPGLASKLMGMNSEPITAKGVNEINLCGSAPVILNKSADNQIRKFTIQQRKGGIGEVALYINKKEVSKLPLESLVFVNNEAEVLIDLNQYQKFLEAGKENSIELIARSADLGISSRGGELLVTPEEHETLAPNLYALVIGVSDYKGRDLDLKFAAKDATDFGNALKASASKLLNIDQREHVFVTTLVTGTDLLPNKKNISDAFNTIIKQAKPNDIIVIYLAGHGEKFGTETTNFYYLTSDASSFDLTGIEKQVSISTNEFADWLKAIPARKQIMILDACASGKLAEDMAVAMRSAIPSNQIKALDRLNSRTGTFILSGAAANQSAYETTAFGQGLLTYSILYGIKTGEALKENTFVDIDLLFQYCADKVKELSKGIGGTQEPVISKPNGGASFDIGKVDSSVSSKILLALPRPVFTNSRFTNPETGEDNLGIEKTIDQLLNENASSGKDAKWVYSNQSQLPESYKIVGMYTVKDKNISVKVRLKKGDQEIAQFEINDFENDIQKLSNKILELIPVKLLVP